jgi:YesN/AraC family two-component response regulator
MHHKISEIASYIHSHYQEPLTLNAVAKRFYISPSYLSRVFVKLTGFHFREYVQVVRIREAEKLLRETKLKVQTISERVGFDHIAHFNRIFKKRSFRPSFRQVTTISICYKCQTRRRAAAQGP